MTGDKFLFSLSAASGNPFATHDSWLPKELQFYSDDPAGLERVIRDVESRLDAIAQQLTMTPRLEVLLAEAKSKVRMRLTAIAQTAAERGRGEQKS